MLCEYAWPAVCVVSAALQSRFTSARIFEFPVSAACVITCTSTDRVPLCSVTPSVPHTQARTGTKLNEHQHQRERAQHRVTTVPQGRPHCQRTVSVSLSLSYCVSIVSSLFQLRSRPPVSLRRRSTPGLCQHDSSLSFGTGICGQLRWATSAVAEASDTTNPLSAVCTRRIAQRRPAPFEGSGAYCWFAASYEKIGRSRWRSTVCTALAGT